MTQRQPQDWLKRAEAIIRDRFSESVSLNEVAKTVAIHPVHLARTFRQHYHCSIGEYVRKLRVEFAREAIVTTDCALTDIGMAAGFYDQSQLCQDLQTCNRFNSQRLTSNDSYSQFAGN